jgi:plasmid stabilization system protein ParE
MTSYRLSRHAERDLIEIARYIAGQANLETAEQVITSVIESIILLGKHSAMGRLVVSLGRGIRCFSSGQYQIYYRKRSRGILVLHIFHAARDQSRAWKSTQHRRMRSVE